MGSRASEASKTALVLSAVLENGLPFTIGTLW